MSDSTAMNRKEFLHLFGLGATALVATACLGGCGSSRDPAPITGATGVDFTVDLSASSSAPLNDAAKGYVYSPSRDVIVAKTAAGGYVAFQAPCPHQGTSVYFSQGQSRFVCPNHNANIDLSGGVVSGPVNQALKEYAVVQTGTLLRITG